MGATELLERLVGPSTEIPADVEDRVKRGMAQLQREGPKRNECWQFWRGNQYCYLNSDGVLQQLPTTTNVRGGGKPRHRVRQGRNLLIDIVRHEVSAATQRVPSYEVSPSTTEAEDYSAAKLAEKVALYGYDAWHIRAAIEKVVTFAVVMDEGFAWPYFDPTVGTPIDGKVATGEIRVRTFGPNEVFWEPGVRFEDSRWHCIIQARAIDEVKRIPGFLGGKLTADANTSPFSFGNPVAQPEANKVMVTEYLERPSPQNRQGRRLIMANGRLIAPPEAYPCTDAKGEYLDEPVLHKLTYIVDPASDRDMGLVRHLLDAQRTINDCTNKLLEAKNLALLPQLLAAPNSLPPGQRITDEPGVVFYAIPVNGQWPKWRDPPPAHLFQLLQEIKEEAKRDMAAISAQNEIPTQVESGRAIQALIERDSGARAAFIAQLAEFHSRLMRHCLYLVQKHYTEPRLLKFRARTGPDSLRDFLGANLRGQCDVRVLPGSIEPRTRESIERRVMSFAQLGWITPEAAMSAINGGLAEKLIESYELDVRRANEVLRKIRAFGSFGSEVPMPRKGVDNLRVHRQIVGDWMKTEEFDTAAPQVKQAAELYMEGIAQLEAEEAAQQAEAQRQEASAYGMHHASKPQLGAQNPSFPNLSGQEAA
jgi:hypothetical protein